MKFPAAVYIALEDPLEAQPFAKWLLSLCVEPGILRLDVWTGSLDPEFEVPTDLTHVRLENGSFRVVVHAEWKFPPEGERICDELESNHIELSHALPQLRRDTENTIRECRRDIDAAERLNMPELVARGRAKLIEVERVDMDLYEGERACEARIRELNQELSTFLDGLLVPLVGRLYADKLGHHTFHVRVAAYTEWDSFTVSNA